MIKILHTADWHIGNFPGPENNGVNLRSLDTGNCINTLQMVVMAEKPDFMVLSGDLFHQARVWADRGLSEVKTAIRALEVISNYCPIIVLRGTPNHDGAEQFDMLKAHFDSNDSVHIITEPSIVQIKGYGISDQWINVACLPGFDRGIFRAKFPGLSKEEENQVFTKELSNIMFGLKAQCNPNMPSMFISHYTVPGCNTESGQTQFLAQFEPVIPPEAIDAANFDLVALGHIHRPQQLLSCKNTFYSGALNAMNFNDEGQDRGFWIHTLEAGNLIKSDFYKTPSREFITLRLDDDKISNWNKNCDDAFTVDVKDKIVRVLYSCTEANAKAINKSLLEKKLYDLGAFWVSEITPEKISVSVNRNAIDKNDPVANLTEYLTEKAYTDEQIAKSIEVGIPIIDEALANTKISRLTGIFEPIEISVKNYRNYEEETFNFDNITFCTINGKNGAGKSSLFMDAILDCLYEEPREGDLTGWIRADEKARSGSIIFTFRIGDKTFRVTRTRAKSGKATLNLSEKIESEWVNRSKEKLKDTQNEIINILGMDSLTFRSCALIMQDQYGLFLEADKESRISILSNILGLGMYDDMQTLAKNALSDTNRDIALNKSEINRLQEKISGLKDIEQKLYESNAQLKGEQNEYDKLLAEKEVQSLSLSMMEKAYERTITLGNEVKTLKTKKAAILSQISQQQDVVSESELILQQKCKIDEGVALHQELLAQEKSLIADKQLYENKISEIAEVKQTQSNISTKIASLEVQKSAMQNKISVIEDKMQQSDELKLAHENWEKAKSELDMCLEQEELFKQLTDEERNAMQELTEATHIYKQTYNNKAVNIKQLQAKMHLLENVQCIDIENATCRFLADAIAAKKQYEPMITECKEWKTKEQQKLSKLEEKHNLAQQALEEFNFDIALPRKLQNKVTALETKAIEYRNLYTLGDQLMTLRNMRTTIINDIDANRAELQVISEKEESIKTDILNLSEKSTMYDNVVKQISATAIWLEKEKQLPVAKVKKSTAEARIFELNNSSVELDIDISQKDNELKKEMQNAFGKDEAEQKLKEASQAISICQAKCEELQRNIGYLTNQLEQIKENQETIKAISDTIKDQSEKAEILDILKQAFSPDGITHNIIRSMLPSITAIANNILGQMTGGKMGMEFRTEKILKSNNKKEVVTLDIFIEEYGKTPLPYSSKSGGEKVKAALSAILALAETKSTSAGIRLGMLFIDEPPFLDGEGIQAYCDALETIGQRYKDIKIMAITHDPAMKARFPQNIDVIKTDNGSKVILG